MRPTWRLAVAAVCMGIFLVAGASAAPRTDGITSLRTASLPRLESGKLESRLAWVALMRRTLGEGIALATARSDALDVSGRRVRVIVEPQAGRGFEAARAVRAAGGRVTARTAGLIEARVRPASLAQLARARSVARIRPPARPVAQAEGDGVAAIHADAWHSAGFGGAGVKIAVIDLGFYGYASLLGSALPATVTTIDHCGGNLAAAPADGGTEHGTAVAEVVHQVAPEAQLYLICIDTEVGLAQAAQDAIAAGVRIVNHSVGWFNTSRGDGSGGPGTPEGIVRNARAHGILWVNAAGDYAQTHWSGTFVPDADDPDVHDFGSGEIYDAFTVTAGDEACVFLKWDAWPVTTEDFDLYVFRVSDDEYITSSNNYQAFEPLPPTEEACFTNTGPTEAFGILILRYSVVGSPRLELFVDGAPALEHRVAAGSVVEPASAPQAVGVGAVCWRDLTIDGLASDDSSRGPTPDGRLKPDLVAPAGVSTTTYGPHPQFGCDGGFRGTSAAAPHVAGAAALLLERTPTLTPSGIEGALEAVSLSHNLATEADNNAGSGSTWLGGLGPSGKLAFPYNDAVHNAIWMMNDDGTGLLKVAAGSSFVAPSWSPDGSRIAFVTANGGAGPWGLFSIAPDGSMLTTALSSAINRDFFSPSWTADGTRLTFDDAVNIKTVNPDGTAPTTVREGRYADWSPDGSKIAFLYPLGTLAQLWIANADGSDPHQVSSGAFGLWPARPAWSPDGTKLAFVRDDLTLWLVNAGGTNQHQLADGWSPEWSADGTRILFVQGNRPIKSIGVDGTDERIVTTGVSLIPSEGGLSWRSQPASTSPSAMSAPTIAGEARTGGILRAGTGDWSGTMPIAVTYSWARCNAAGGGCVGIGGAVDNLYAPTGGDLGHTLRVTVSVANSVATTAATSAATATVTGDPTAPGAPTTVSAAAQDGQALVSFAPSHEGGSPITSYLVTSSPGGLTATGPTSPLTVTGLTNGVAYTFTVTATNTIGTSPASAPSSAVTPPGLPGAPTGVTAIPHDGQASVSFAAPTVTNGWAIDHYTVTASPGGASASGGASPITVTGLTNGTSYTFTVTATNTNGPGPASAASASVTPAAASRPLPPPPPDEAGPRPPLPVVAPPSGVRKPPPVH